ncbi:MAG: alpha-E domain-containing protein [Bacteroidota bacterium]
MLARIADSLFWMSRYIERADGIMRMLKINYTASLDKSGAEEFSWKPVLRLFSTLNDVEIEAIEKDSKKVMHYMIDDRNNGNSLFNIIRNARENARGVQDHITLEVWSCVNDFYHDIRSENVHQMVEDDQSIQLLDGLLKNGLLYYGTSDITMPRGEGWSFMNIGKALERALQTVDLLDSKYSALQYDLNAHAETPYWRFLLMSASGYELYVKTYREGLNGKHIAEMMILNTDFPRAILYSIVQLTRNFEKIRSDRNLESYREIEVLIGKLRSTIRYTDVSKLSQEGLKNTLLNTRSELFQISNALNTYYFNYY